jgi:hypothetical protein
MNRILASGAILLVSASVIALSAGCSSTQKATSNGSDAGSSTTDGGVSAPPGLSCLQILQCIVACPDSDAACPDACLEKGDAEGKTNITAFVTCVDQEKCADAACVQDKCATPLDACVTSSAPKNSGTPLQGSAPPGSVPTDLVGEWVGARDGITQRFMFNADGSGEWRSAITSSQSACKHFTTTTRTGNFVITDTTITVYATSVVESVQRCAPPAEDTNQPAVTEELMWHRADGDPNTILVVDNACAAKYPGQENCNTLGCPIGLYCTARLTRQ